MLAGLLIATHDADDRPGMLTATLPFGGVTLIEYQARLLIAAGASQIVVVVARLTPELLGAISRIARRGVTVDTVRSAAEAAEKLHPLARLLMLADGLTTTEDIVGGMARDGGDALLVVDEAQVGTGYERVGGGMAWAGIARLDPRRLQELAAMPRDYDIQSTLIRLASQARALHIMLPDGAIKHGHGIDHVGAQLDIRGRTVLAAMVSGRSGWFDRIVIAPIARAIIPMLVPRAVPLAAVAGGAGALGLAGLMALWADLPVTGLVTTLVAAVGLTLAAILADLRDEPRPSRWLDLAAAVLPAVAVLLHAQREGYYAAAGTAPAIAIALVAAAILAERAALRRPRRTWWGGAPAYLLVVTIGAVVAMPLVGFGLAAGYAAATLASAIEGLRRDA